MRDPKTKTLFDRVLSAYGIHLGIEQGDFSERLLKLVEEITHRYKNLPAVMKSSQVTELIYKEDIKNLQNSLEDYLSAKEEVWVLVDNLDKGWPVQGATDEDILILRTLLSATRKMQREFEKRGIEFRSLVFIRNDIYDHLIRKTADREKDTIITLDWEDIEIFRQIVLARIRASAKVEGGFEEVWRSYFAPLIGGEDSFIYITDRTLMRPRDMLKFLQYALEIAINHNHDKASEEDIVQAEKVYSEDLLQNLVYEIKDVYPLYPDLIYEFLGCAEKMERDDLLKILVKAQVPQEKVVDVMNMLIWFGFLGVIDKQGNIRYSYQVQYATFKLGIKESNAFTIHPAFRLALECIN